jgi:adenine-specific DNA-methyltransferase
VSQAEDIIGGCRLMWGDALEVLPTLSDASVNLILTDPPYYRVKAEGWDRQWPTRDAYLGWLRQMAKEWQRVLTPNGSLYCFASPQMATWVEVTLSETFNVLTRIQWLKAAGWHNKTVAEELRGWLSPREEILFAEQYGSDSMALGDSGYAAQCQQLHSFVFEPLRAYLDGERLRAGISFEEVRQMVGCASGSGLPSHWFSRSQWGLPPREQYGKLQVGFNVHNGHTDYLRREYEDLRREYEGLRREYEDLRRPFTVSPRVPYTDVWDFATVPTGPGKHPCEKPLPLLRHIITASSRPGDVVLDTCAGSFATLDAARQCGRRGIGIEQEGRWYRAGIDRLSQGLLFTEVS